jgi:formamidopyrimidine-DNA glycosylase
MPEIAEVAVIVSQLQSIKKQKLTAVTVLGGKYINNPFNISITFPTILHSVKHLGKTIIFTFDNNEVIIVGLGMTGRFSYDEEKHSHIKFSFDKPLYFVDSRCFGILSSDMSRITSLAPSIINTPHIYQNNIITEEDFITRGKILFSKRNICTVLMDQRSLTSGVGNYMLSEALYIARINPWISFVSDQNLKLLYKALVKIGNTSLNLGGVSVKTYKDVDGNKGSGKNQLSVYMKKYDSFGNSVVQKKGPHGRTIHYVHELQKPEFRVLMSGYRHFNCPVITKLGLMQTIEDDCQMVLLHGNCAGADITASLEAKKLGWKIEVYNADWNKGHSAGPIRNQYMMEQKPDYGLLFLSDNSKGTKNMMRRMDKNDLNYILMKI